MEGSRIARTKETRPDTAEILRRGGLPAKSAGAWAKVSPRVTGSLKRDAAAATRFWRTGGDLLTKLPKKQQRTQEQQSAADVILSACRRLREEFLKKHADTIYRRLTKNLSAFRRSVLGIMCRSERTPIGAAVRIRAKNPHFSESERGTPFKMTACRRRQCFVTLSLSML